MNDVRIQLYLVGNTEPELHRIKFFHPLLPEERVSVRSKASPLHEGTFQWTLAVQSLCVLFLEHAYSKSAVISGTANSLAASLDYALSKQPQWILDIFGVDKKGRTLARRVLTRTNSERKRKGPVLVAVNPKVNVQIDVLLNGVLVCSADLIKQIATSVRSVAEQRLSQRVVVADFQANGRLVAPKAAETLTHEFRPWLHNIFTAEIAEMLRNSNVFSPLRVKQKVHAIVTNPSVKRVVRNSVPWVSEVDLQLSPAERRGMGIDDAALRAALSRPDPIRCSVPWITLGALALFEYLRNVKGYNLEINYAYNYTAELRRDVVNGRVKELPDVCVHGIGPAATFMHDAFRLGYSPLMFLPQVSHRVVVPHGLGKAGPSGISEGEYAFLCEEASSPWFYFDELHRRGLVAKSQRKSKITHIEPDEMMNLINQGNPELRALIFFPHYALHERFGACVAHRSQLGIDDTETVMFTHARLNQEPHRLRCLDVALRNAWYELLERPNALDAVVGTMLSENEFLRFVSRSIGYQDIPAAG